MLNSKLIGSYFISSNKNKSIMRDLTELNVVSPEPISIPIQDEVKKDLEIDPLEPADTIHEDLEKSYIGPKPIYYKFQKISNQILKPIQKYSSISFSIFAAIHGITITMGPLISVDFANELLSLGRSIYQSPGFEEVLVWGTLFVHVAAGMMIRIIKQWGDRVKYGGRVRRIQKVKRNDSLVDDRIVLKKSKDGKSIEVKDDSQIGLIGGVTNIFGLGMRKNWTFRKFGMTTLQLSGWLSLPLIIYHFLQVRVIPLMIDGDSGYINFEYISYLFQKYEIWSVVGVLNTLVYSSLIYLTTYHIISGFVKWNNVTNLKIRKLLVLLINIIGLVNLYNFYKFSRVDLEFIPNFVIKKFDEYLNYFYDLKFLFK